MHSLRQINHKNNSEKVAMNLPKLLGSRSKLASPSAGRKLKRSVSADRTLPSATSEITTRFLEEALRESGALPPEDVGIESIKVELTSVQGLLSTVCRVRLTYRSAKRDYDTSVLPASVIVKLQAESRTNRGLALEAGCYAKERSVYERLGSELRSCIPACHLVAADPESDNVVFVMEDLTLREGLYQVSQFAPGACSKADATAVAHAFGKLHAKYWSRNSVSAESVDWLANTRQVALRNATEMTSQCGELFRSSAYYTGLDENVRAAIDIVMQKATLVDDALASGPCTILHHDARVDNIFFGDATACGGVLLVDWQLAGKGVGAIDLAWFAATSFQEPGDPTREADNRHLVEVYWRSLVAAGVDSAKYTLDMAWRDYLLGLVWSFLCATQVVKYGEPNEFLMTLSRRIAHAMYELEAHLIPCHRLVGSIIITS